MRNDREVCDCRMPVLGVLNKSNNFRKCTNLERWHGLTDFQGSFTVFEQRCYYCVRMFKNECSDMGRTYGLTVCCIVHAIW